jgi:hypothetical protein
MRACPISTRTVDDTPIGDELGGEAITLEVLVP